MFGFVMWQWWFFCGFFCGWFQMFAGAQAWSFFPQEFPVVRGLVCVLTWIACLWCVLRTTECDNEDVIRVRK